MSGEDPLEAFINNFRAGKPTAVKSLDEIRAARGLIDADPRFDSLLSKLRSARFEVVNEGIGELVATGDGALFDRFLKGVSFESGSGKSDVLQNVLGHVVITLLIEAPESSTLAAAAREAITRLEVHLYLPGVRIDRDRWFPRLPNLTSFGISRVHLTGSAPHPRLERVNLEGSDIDDLAGLAASLTTLRLDRVKLAGGAPLTSLDCLEGATALDTLTVESTELTCVRALASALNLRCLKLEGCSKLQDISALEGHPSLRAIGLFGTAVDKESVAKGLRAICSWKRKTDYHAMLEKPPQLPRGAPKPAKRALSAAAKTALAEVRELLAGSDTQAMDAWLAKIAALGDPGVFDELLEPVAYDKEKRRLASRTYRGPLGTYAMLGLLAGAPATSRAASELRAAIQHLHVTRSEAMSDLPIDLLHLEALPNLEGFELRSAGPLVKRHRAPSLPLVRTITLHHVAGLEDLAFIAGCPSLSSLDIAGADGLSSLEALRGNASIKFLYFADLPAVASLEGVAQMPALYSLNMASFPALTSLDALADLPALEGIKLRNCEALGDLRRIQDLEALEMLELTGLPAVQSLEALRGHPRLRFVEIEHMDLASIEPLAGVPSLDTLYLNSPGPIASLAPLAGLSKLQYLSVSRCPKLRSIDSLAGLPLRTLRLKQTGVKDVPEALEGAWDRD